MAAEVAPLSSTEQGKTAARSASPPPILESTSDTPADPAIDLTSEPSPRLSPQDAVDFLLHPMEIARGRTAAENYLSACRSEESRRFAQEALETLATVISDGRCDGLEFPWQQVRPYHGAAALTILKEKGAPARIEALRCRRDNTRSYRVVPESFPPGQVQKIRTTLTKVIEACSELGFVAEPAETPVSTKKVAKKTTARGRLLGDGELRALVAASSSCENAEGSRDAVFFALVYRGLKMAEITSLTIESVRFSNKTGICTIVSTAGGGRGRRVEMTNADLICLEDWLDYRGDRDGPLLCTIGRAGKIEGKRLTTAVLKEVCARRAKEAEVVPFVPNDLSRSAEALTEHRKAVRKKTAKLALDAPSTTELVLFDSASAKGDPPSQAIRFPFLGLAI